MKTKIIIGVFAYNEGEKLSLTLSRHPKKRNYDLLVVDDGSNDDSIQKIPSDVLLVKNNKNMGIGFSMKLFFKYALTNSYEIIVIQAGNNKDDPLEIPKLIDPILNNRADFVQGSRFLKGGFYGNTPIYRIFATKFIHPFLFSLATGKKVTESTNGFRAFRVRLLKDKKINWQQSWLDKYELEPYLLYKAIKLGYRHIEVPVNKIYPKKGISYSKMKPLIGWWSILKPIFYLWLGIKN